MMTFLYTPLYDVLSLSKLRIRLCSYSCNEVERYAYYLHIAIAIVDQA